MKRFQRILVYAGTEQPDLTVARAAQLALENDAVLTLMDVVKPIPRALGMITDAAKPEELEKLVVADRRRRLLDLAGDVAQSGLQSELVVAVGDPATEITRQVVSQGHDLVVKTADGFSAAGRSFGSVAQSLLRLCPCPVWLLKPQIHGEFDKVLAAIDVESEDRQHVDLNQKILEFAYSIAQRDDAELHVVAVWQLWMENSLRRHAGDAAVDSMRERHEAKVRKALDELLQTPDARTDEIHLHLQQGSPASMIRNVADEIEADLMVMGTVCRTGAAGFLIGNTAETVISGVTCSLLALKPDRFVSPIQMSASSLPETDQPLPLI